MKKILISILIFILMFNFIVCNMNFAAEDDWTPDTSQFEKADSTGTTVDPSGKESGIGEYSGPSTSGAIVGILAAVIDAIPMFINMLLNSFANDGGFIDYDLTLPNIEKRDFTYLTIEKIVFGHYYLFNANMFKSSQDFPVTDRDGNNAASDDLTKTLDSLRENVATWHTVTKLIAMVLGIITLIYIGIRMAMSTIASDQAKYKKMLVAWVQSIIIIVMLPYIMAVINYVGSILMDIVKALGEAITSTTGQKSFEIEIIDSIYAEFATKGGMTLAAYSIAFWVLVFTEFKFFMMYIKRLFAVAFLVVISPLISITYSIDKAGDGQAQAFQAWFKEYLINILIQPFQAALYLVFVYSANEIAIKAPIVGIIFLFSLTRAEKIVKEIFNMRGLSSLSTMKLFNKK